MNYLFLAAGVIVVTGIAHTLSGMMIAKVRAVATNSPSRLRGVTPQEALAKAAHWEQNRKRLWPLAAIVACGFVVFGLIGS